MISASSALAYEAILRCLSESVKPVYRMIYENPDICIGEIGHELGMQNSTVSGRVNDLIEDGLVFYVTKDGKPELKVSRVSGMQVKKLRVNDVFAVEMKRNGKEPRAKMEVLNCAGPEQFRSQGSLFPNSTNNKAA